MKYLLTGAQMQRADKYTIEEIGIPSMVLYHFFIGIIEAVLTVIVLAALDKFRPDLLAWNNESVKKIEGDA